jgi:hypothetical protein
MLTVKHNLRGYGYAIDQVDHFSVAVDPQTGLLELLAHIPATDQDIARMLVIFEDYNTSHNYDLLCNLASIADGHINK